MQSHVLTNSALLKQPTPATGAPSREQSYFFVCRSHFPTSCHPPAAPHGAGICSAQQGIQPEQRCELKQPQFPQPATPMGKGSSVLLTKSARFCSASSPLRTSGLCRSQKQEPSRCPFEPWCWMRASVHEPPRVPQAQRAVRWVGDIPPGCLCL